MIGNIVAGRVITGGAEQFAGEAGVVIRHARLRDLAELQELQRSCFRSGQGYGLITLLVLCLWPRAQVLVARSSGRIAGCVVGDITGNQGRILNLCVDPGFRRQGIGAALLAAAEDLLNADDIALMVEDKNIGAQELYRRSGYLAVGDLRNYYGTNRHGILMQKRRGVPQPPPSAGTSP
jgi:ribosomal-protein-alanine N-acetyltransferase